MRGNPFRHGVDRGQPSAAEAAFRCLRIGHQVEEEVDTIHAGIANEHAQNIGQAKGYR